MIPVLVATVAGIGSFFAIGKFGKNKQASATEKGVTVSLETPRQEAAQPLQQGQRKPTPQELAHLLAFGMDVPADDSGQRSAAQQAFSASLPDVNWNAPTDSEVNAALAIIASAKASGQSV